MESTHYNKKLIQVKSDTEAEYLINQRLSKIPEIIKIIRVEYNLEKDIFKNYTEKFKELSKIVQNKTDLLVYEYYDEIQLIEYLKKLKTIKEILERVNNVCEQLFLIMNKIYKVEPEFYFCNLTPYNIFINEKTKKIKISDLNHGTSIFNKNKPILNHLLYSKERSLDMKVLIKTSKEGINTARRMDLYIFMWYILVFILNNKTVNSNLNKENLKFFKNKFLKSVYSYILDFTISVNKKSESVENLLKNKKMDNKIIKLVVNELYQYCITKPLNLKFIKTIKN